LRYQHQTWYTTYSRPYNSRLAGIDLEVKRSNVKVTRLRKPSRCTVASDHGRYCVFICCATCGRCRRWSACLYDCLCFLVKYSVQIQNVHQLQQHRLRPTARYLHDASQLNPSHRPDGKSSVECSSSSFLANVNVLRYVCYMLSAVRLLSVVCLLSVCDVGAPYSGG